MATFSLSSTPCSIKFQMYHAYNGKNWVLPALRGQKISEGYTLDCSSRLDMAIKLWMSYTMLLWKNRWEGRFGEDELDDATVTNNKKISLALHHSHFLN